MSSGVVEREGLLGCEEDEEEEGEVRWGEDGIAPVDRLAATVLAT